MSKITNFFIIILLLALNSAAQDDSSTHKIIYLISPPRSLSVAFLRMMQARGDFVIMHEPSQLAYDSIKYPHETHDWFLESAPTDYAQVKEQIFLEAKRSSVFVKEISFAVQDFLKDDEELVKDPRVQFVFLLRNPHHATISFYKKSDAVFLENEQDFSDLIGYKAAYELYKVLSERALHEPLVILSEDLYTHPKEILGLFCQEAGIEYKPEALSWDRLDTNFDGQEWHEIKHSGVMHHWHGDAIKSSGFGKPTYYQVDENDQPTFSEIEDIRHREICKKAYQENKHYHYLLLARAHKRAIFGPRYEN